MKRSVLALLVMASTACGLSMGRSGAAVPGQVKPDKALEIGQQAEQAGRLQEALAFYEAAMASGVRDLPLLEELTYRAAVIRMSPESAAHDPERARAYLTYLRDHFATGAYRLEVAGLLAAQDELARARSELQEAQRRLSEAEANARWFEEQLEAALARADQAAVQQVDSGETQALRGQVRNLRSEVERLQAEIEKKDAALKRLADTVVGRRPS